MTFADVLAWHARCRPARVAVQDAENAYTYSELWASACALGEALKAYGARRQQPVMVLAENSARVVVLYAACMRMGFIFSPVNYRLTSSELAEVSDILEPALIVTDNDYASDLPGRVVGVDELYARSVPAQMAEKQCRPAGMAEINNILFTSGTSGVPKGAALTHGNIYACAANVVYHQGLSHNDRVFVALPLYHTAALHLQVTPALYCGAALQVMRRWDSSGFLEHHRRGQVTTTFLLPEQWQEVCDASPDGRESPLRLGLTGGLVGDDTLTSVKRTFGQYPGLAMGMTEVSPQICYISPSEMPLHGGSVGHQTVWAELDVSEGVVGGPSSGIGELRIRGPLVMDRYWKRSDATAESFDSEGFFHGGDMVRIDSGGYIYIVDRLKDIIRSGGETVYSLEVEEVLRRHCWLRDACVIGMPHPRWGEAVTAVVVPVGSSSPSLEQLQRLCRDAGLASYKKPLKLVVVEKLPRNATGKVLKKELRRMCVEAADGPVTAY